MFGGKGLETVRHGFGEGVDILTGRPGDDGGDGDVIFVLVAAVELGPFDVILNLFLDDLFAGAGAGYHAADAAAEGDEGEQRG